MPSAGEGKWKWGENNFLNNNGGLQNVYFFQSRFRMTVGMRAGFKTEPGPAKGDYICKYLRLRYCHPHPSAFPGLALRVPDKPSPRREASRGHPEGTNSPGHFHTPSSIFF